MILRSYLDFHRSIDPVVKKGTTRLNQEKAKAQAEPSSSRLLSYVIDVGVLGCNTIRHVK
jgi:hypothetical protein